MTLSPVSHAQISVCLFTSRDFRNQPNSYFTVVIEVSPETRLHFSFGCRQTLFVTTLRRTNKTKSSYCSVLHDAGRPSVSSTDHQLQHWPGASPRRIRETCGWRTKKRRVSKQTNTFRSEASAQKHWLLCLDVETKEKNLFLSFQIRVTNTKEQQRSLNYKLLRLSSCHTGSLAEE